MLSKVVPNFSWGGVERVEPEKFIAAVKMVMGRRGKNLGSEQEAKLRGAINL